MPNEVDELDLFALGAAVNAEYRRLGGDPGYGTVLLRAEAGELIASGERDPARLAAVLLGKTPAKYRLDPASVAAREQAAVRQDLEQDGNVFDAIRARVRASEEARRPVDLSARLRGTT
jgi:hypothetical protein